MFELLNHFSYICLVVSKALGKVALLLGKLQDSFRKEYDGDHSKITCSPHLYGVTLAKTYKFYNKRERDQIDRFFCDIVY